MTVVKSYASNICICPFVKFIAAQIMICYDVSFSAFKDYFHLEENISCKCVSKVLHEIVDCNYLAGWDLRSFTQSDAGNIGALHKSVSNVEGVSWLLGCHNSPLSSIACLSACWKGPFERKEGYPNIDLKAVAYFTLWFGHGVLDFAGTLNNIGI